VERGFQYSNKAIKINQLREQSRVAQHDFSPRFRIQVPEFSKKIRSSEHDFVLLKDRQTLPKLRTWVRFSIARSSHLASPQ